MSHLNRCPNGSATFEREFQVVQKRLRQTVRRIPRFGGNDQLHIPSKFVLREMRCAAVSVSVSSASSATTVKSKSASEVEPHLLKLQNLRPPGFSDLSGQ